MSGRKFPIIYSLNPDSAYVDRLGMLICPRHQVLGWAAQLPATTDQRPNALRGKP